MNFSTKDAIREWEIEVQAEMRRLIERGVPPYDAADKARDIVSERRRNAAIAAAMALSPAARSGS